MVIRVRPPNQRELALPGGVIVEVGQDEKQIIVTGKPPFSYDIALSLKVTQEECFEKVGLEIVQTAYNGYNSSMFAYGQTSSGKSFSMMGAKESESKSGDGSQSQEAQEQDHPQGIA